jgi:hypothetical protein
MPTRCNRWFLLQILLLAQHVSGTTMPIIRSSRVLYRWLLPVVFSALVFKLSVWCGAEGYVSGLRAAVMYKVEVKCQLDATDEFYCRFYCLLNMVRAPLYPSWGLCFRFAGCCSSPQTGHTTLSSTPYRQLKNQSTKYHRQEPPV